MDTDEKCIALVKGLQAETKNILIEHLSADEIAELAAHDLAAHIGQSLKQFFLVSMELKGELDMDALLQTMVKFASFKLGREVEL